MLTISLVGQKGGGGKSTCCWIFVQAVLARPGNLKVLLIETDTQGSTKGFVQGAHAQYPDLTSRLFCERASSAEEIYELIEGAEEEGIDFVIIDTEGRHSDLARGVMAISDRIIIPVKPVNHEYRSQLATLAVYESILETFTDQGTPPPPCGLLLNNYNPTKKLTIEQAEDMTEVTSHPRLLPFYMPHRSNFQTLGKGRILFKEKEAMGANSHSFRAKQIDADLLEADGILKEIEGMK